MLCRLPGLESEAPSWFTHVYPLTQAPDWPYARPLDILQVGCTCMLMFMFSRCLWLHARGPPTFTPAPRLRSAGSTRAAALHVGTRRDRLCARRVVACGAQPGHDHRSHPQLRQQLHLPARVGPHPAQPPQDGSQVVRPLQAFGFQANTVNFLALVCIQGSNMWWELRSCLA